MLKSAVLLVIAAGLMVAAVLLWTRGLIIFAAPVGVASLAAVWATIDNHLIYKPQRVEPPPGVESGPGGAAGA